MCMSRSRGCSHDIPYWDWNGVYAGREPPKLPEVDGLGL